MGPEMQEPGLPRDARDHDAAREVRPDPGAGPAGIPIGGGGNYNTSERIQARSAKIEQEKIDLERQQHEFERTRHLNWCLGWHLGGEVLKWLGRGAVVGLAGGVLVKTILKLRRPS